VATNYWVGVPLMRQLVAGVLFQEGAPHPPTLDPLQVGVLGVGLLQAAVLLVVQPVHTKRRPLIITDRCVRIE
jgi:hypothetical protein